jgi:hypothetical protein
MMLFINKVLRILLSVSTVWVASLAAQEHRGGIIPSDDEGAVGYQHSLDRSRFSVGTPTTSQRRLTENGFAKVIGPEGVFATNVANGLTVALQSDGSDKPGARAEGLARLKTVFTGEPEKHNKQVFEYFVRAGLPKAQVGGTHANTYLIANGSGKDKRLAETHVDGYATILERQIERYSVVDSVAWARLNDEGKVISEWVYWPAIPGKVISDAKRLEEMVRNSNKEGFLSRLPPGLPPGKVVIRHSSATEEGKFEVFASYDVLETKTLVAAVPATGQNLKTENSIVLTRHFDVSGTERRLPQERRNLGPDRPPKKTEAVPN